jgi:hypothetical protein
MEEDSPTQQDGSKDDWIEDYRELKKDLIMHDNKEIFKCLNFTRTTTLKNEIQALFKLEDDRSVERIIERDDLLKFIRSLKADLKRLKEALKIYASNPDYLAKIGPITEEIEQKVTNFKERNVIYFDRILEEENRLLNDINKIALNIESYETPIEPKELPRSLLETKNTTNFIIKTQKPGKPPIAHPLSKSKTSEYELDFPDELGYLDTDGEDEMAELESQLKNIKIELDDLDKDLSSLGGISLGWKNGDHKIFLMIKSKFKGDFENPAFEQEIYQELPFMKEPDVLDHIEKYKIFMEISEKKKELVLKYKETKQKKEEEVKKLKEKG